jgi:alkylglycerol monooxygenase
MAGLKKMWDEMSLFGFRRLFYLVTPEETRFKSADEIPNYFDKAIPWFLTLVVIEFVVLQLQGKHLAYALNDMITCVMAGLFSMLCKLVIRGLGLIVYTNIYENYRMIDLPPDAVSTWVLCFVTQDLAYYLLHRATHEVGFLWAFHQMHHSSEYYNLSTALRQGGIQELAAMCFECIQGLFMPPSVYLVHRYMNILYQFWIHTEAIPKLGPLEYIINTPSHHRVHHGRNPYCIDRNYAGTLIIWDRLLGTFIEEKDDEQIAYGLVHNVRTFDQLYCQIFAFKELGYTKPWKWVKGSTWDSLQAYVMPPGWFPGSNVTWFLWWRMRDTEHGIPKIKYPVKPYNPQVADWMKVYAFAHFVLHVLSYQAFAINNKDMSVTESCTAVFFLVMCMQSIGALFDKRSYAPWLELSRCVLTILFLLATTKDTVLIIVYSLSTIPWILHALRTSRVPVNEKKSD